MQALKGYHTQPTLCRVYHQKPTRYEDGLIQVFDGQSDLLENLIGKTEVMETLFFINCKAKSHEIIGKTLC